MFKELAYYDGKIGTPDEVMIPFNDRSHFFGDGVYDATIGGNHVVYLLEDHLDRFYTSANYFDIKIPMGKRELGELLTDLLRQVEGETHFVYWQVTRGVASRNHAYGKDMPGKLWVWIKPSKAGDPNEELKLIVRPDTRFQHGNAKTLNLLPAVMGTELAVRAGADECVLHRDGFVTECCHSNIQILKDGMLIAHPDDQFILRGIAKTHMIEACRRLGITVMERPFSLEEMYDADEVIVTASSRMCQHACEIEGRKVGGKDPETLHRIEKEVIQEYLDYTGKATLLD